MGRQHKQALDQGNDQQRYNNRRNNLDELPHHPGNKDQRRKRSDSSQNGKGDRNSDLGCPLNGRLHKSFTPLPVFKNIFTDDNRIIDDDTEGEDKGKQ